MSGNELIAPPVLSGDGPRTDYNRIVIVGGGCYGSYYVRQLLRARDAGAIAWTALDVVDRNAACAAGGLSQDVNLVTAEWSAFFERYLGQGADTPASVERDGIVPSPLMPHLMYQWLVARTAQRFPECSVESRALDVAPDVPWHRAGGDGTSYVSFATWTCPINCIEPARCPHTRDVRDWTMPAAARAYVERAGQRGYALAGPIIFHCTHRAYGVGMFDTSAVVAADAFVARVGAGAPGILIGTMSHCHGAWSVLRVARRESE